MCIYTYRYTTMFCDPYDKLCRKPHVTKTFPKLLSGSLSEGALTRALTGGSGWDKIWGFPKTRGTILGVPIIRTIVFWGLYGDPPVLENYHLSKVKTICWKLSWLE